MLHPNNKQATKLFLNANASRYAYNWAVAAEQENHKQNKPFIKEFELRKQFTKFKKTPEYNTKFDAASNNSMKQGIRDAIAAYKHFFNGKAKVPRFHSYQNWLFSNPGKSVFREGPAFDCLVRIQPS